MSKKAILNQKLEGVRREYRQTHRHTAQAWLFAAALTALIALVILDKIFALPVWIRQLSLGGAVAGIVAACVIFYRRNASRKLPDEQIALYVEEKIGGFDEALVTAATVQPEKLPPEEKPLAEALIHQVEKKIMWRDITTAVDFRALRKATVVGLVCFVLALLTAAAFPPQLKRVLFPFERGARIAKVKIDVTPKSIEVPRGGLAGVTATVTGAPRQDVQLVYTPMEGPERLLTMAWQEPARNYSAELMDISSDGTYKVALTDRSSPAYPIKTFVPPAVTSVEHTLTFPDYLSLPPKNEKGGELTAVQGTNAHVSLQFNKPVAKCEILMKEGAAPPVRLGNSEAQVDFKISSDTTYTVRLTDKEGRTNADGQQFKIRALPDNPPEVTIVEPGGDVELDKGMEQGLRMDATDDFGVAKFSLVYNINGGEEHRIDLDQLKAEIPPLELVGKYLVNEESVSLKPGDIMTYYAEAEDANTLTGPGKTATKRFFIFGMLPYEDKDGKSGNKTPPPSLTAIQRQIIVATATLADAPADGKNAAAHSDDCEKMSLSEAELLRIVDELEAQIPADDTTRKWARQDVLPLLASARDSLKANDTAGALASEQKSLPLLYQLDARIRSKQSNGGGSGSNDQLFHDIVTKQVTDSALPDEMKEGRPCNGKSCASEEHAPELLAAVRRMEELARRQMKLNEAQQQAGAENGALAKQQEELAKEAEKQAEELEQTAANDRGASPMSSAAAQLREAARQMKAGAKGMAEGKQGAAKAGARAAEQALYEAVERLSNTSEQSIAEQMKDAAAEARTLAEKQRELNAQAKAAKGAKGNGNQSAAAKAAENAAKQAAVDKEVEELRDDLQRLRGVANDLAKSGAARADTVEQIDKALDQIPQTPPADEKALERAAAFLDAAAQEVSPQEQMERAAQDTAELVASLEKMTSGDAATGPGSEISTGRGIGGEHAWAFPDWSCLRDPVVRETAMELSEQLARAERLPDEEKIKFLSAEVLPVAKKLQEQLSARASGKPEYLLVTQGLDDDYPPEYRPVVEDYFKELAKHPELKPRAGTAE